MRTSPLVRPDLKNPRDLARTALSALQLANNWAGRPGRFANGITRVYVRHACGLLRLANALCAKRADEVRRG